MRWIAWVNLCHRHIPQLVSIVDIFGKGNERTDSNVRTVARQGSPREHCTLRDSGTYHMHGSYMYAWVPLRGSGTFIVRYLTYLAEVVSAEVTLLMDVCRWGAR